MKNLILATALAASLAGCATEEDKNKLGAFITGAGALAICAQVGACIFPL